MPRGARRALAWVVLPLVLAGCGRAGLILGFFARNFASLARPMDRLPARITEPARADARLAALWVGHSTVLVQLDDKFILTDPVFTDTVGQISKRMVEPGLDPEHLPRLDAVLVSHMHFDHLSLGTLDLIEDSVERVYLPEGGAVYVPSSGVPTIELPPWQSHEVGGLRVTAVPVRHVGFRYSGDREWMTHSFTGYVVEYHGLSVYFGGDTAYTRAFRDTAERFPGIDLAILPIAPIHPRSFMCRTHTDPSEALIAFGDLGARHMLPVHYDTFVNSLDEFGEAPRVLRGLLAARGLDAERVAILAHGEQRVFVAR
ncbi:MAG TPA: MBL fold metallo-hydrolase [Polyangiaceae bacterium]|nr:MBL fold metallo-hydrolase [Polyangiaceae bacterium]